VKGYFITSTGTGIGKTYVTAALTRELKAGGVAVRAIKPLISGYDEASAPASDTALILQALGRPFDPAEIERVSPWRYEAALGPDMAARRAGTMVDYPALLQFCREGAQGGEDVLFVEGVGGAFVPLTEKYVVADWIAALGLPSLLVAGTYLGAISHTLATVKAMRRHGLDIAAVVVSQSEASPASLEETVASLHNFLPDMPLVAISRHGGVESLVQILKLQAGKVLPLAAAVAPVTGSSCRS
jgi:dethiobiotin synthetase